MGLYDSFYLKTKCPYCKEVVVREFQTKQFSCSMGVWHEGDVAVINGLKIEDGIIYGVYGGCNSKTCDKWQEKKDGYKSGFGRSFECDVLIKKGKIKGAVNIKRS